jgi:glycosyltransferase involved in cell wall biosynthesis
LKLPKGIEKEIVVVDDCSTNNVLLTLKKIEKDPEIKLIRHKANTGKGGAIKTGIAESTGNIIVPQDGDLEYDPKDINTLLDCLISKNYDVIYGSRLKKEAKQLYATNLIANKQLTGLINLFFGSKLTDSMTCYKMFRKNAISGIDLKSKGFAFDAEITCKILKKGIKISEIGINYYPRTYEQGKNIRWLDGLKILGAILKYRFIG